MQEVLPSIQKPLLKRFGDPVEKCRELAILIIKKFFNECDDLTISFPYIFPVLVEKLGATNLEGTDGLPDVMKPPPSQKPKMIVSPPEPSEEVRLQLAEIVTCMIQKTISDWFRAYLDDLVNILCTLAMDPYGEVIREACDAYYHLWNNDPELLFHFTVIMGRSTFLALTHKHAKVRCAGLKALNAIMYWGTWKYTVDIFEALIGFRDPHVVPIKDFYEPSIKINYFARFVTDRSTLVRETFYKTLANWLLKLPDKVDHEGRIIPYMLSALNDPNDNIQDLAFELLEEMGMDFEEREEKKVRDTKQYSLDAEWTNNGEFIDLPLPRPFKHRPRLGARNVIRGYVRRYLKAIYKELSDWILENRQRAAHLLLWLLVYTEDYITQFLDHLLLSLYKAILEKEDMVLKEKLEIWAKLIGRYCSAETFKPFLFSTIWGEYTYDWSQIGALKTFGCIIQGTIEVIPRDSDFTKIDDLVQRVFDAVQDKLIEPLDFELAEKLVETFDRMFDSLLAKIEKDETDISIFAKYERQFFMMIASWFGVFNIHSLFDKEPSERNKELKHIWIALFEKLNKLLSISKNGEKFDVLNKWLPLVFYNILNSEIENWTMQDQNLRIFNGFINHMEQSNSRATLDECLIEVENAELSHFKDRISKYNLDKKEEFHKRYNKHLVEPTLPRRDLAAIEEMKEENDDKENTAPEDPAVEEETIVTTSGDGKEKESENPFLQKKVQQKEEGTIEVGGEFETFFSEEKSVIGMALNIMLKLLHHPSYSLTKYSLSKHRSLLSLCPPTSPLPLLHLSAALSITPTSKPLRKSLLTSILTHLSPSNLEGKVHLGEDNLEAFYGLMNSLRILYEDYNLDIRLDGVKVMRWLVGLYVDYLNTQKGNRESVLKQNTFVHRLFKDLFLLATEEEDIRLMATDCLMVIIDEFLPPAPIVKGDAYNDTLSDVRMNISKAFDSSEKMERIEEFARLEASMVKHIYDDPGLFMQGVVKLAIDETNGANRDRLMEIIYKMNEKLPYTVLCDFRRANSLGMFKRVELMKNIVVK
jgi:hypothetical protein